MAPFPGDPMKAYPPLPPALRARLARIEPSVDRTVRADPCRYYPCTVTLTSGARVDRVHLAEARSWRRAWGVWPEDDRGKPWIDGRDGLPRLTGEVVLMNVNAASLGRIAPGVAAGGALSVEPRSRLE
jgi:hypothetical protein